MNHYISCICMQVIYMWAMSQKLPVDGFEKRIAKSNKYFTKHYDENNDTGYVLEVDVEYLKRLHSFHNDLPFLPERMRTISLYAICMIKTIMLRT